MRAKMNETNVKFSQIMNEGQLDHIMTSAEQTGCKFTISDFSTKVEVTGTKEQITKFINVYNE